MKSSMTINTPIEINHTRIADLLCTSLEGGVYYWAKYELKYEPTLQEQGDEEKYGEWVLFPQFMITHPLFCLSIKDFEEGEDYDLNLETLESGLGVMAKKYGRHFKDFCEGDEDAITGDVFLQCCVFGEVVYG
jgi:hypothetical protein